MVEGGADVQEGLGLGQTLLTMYRRSVYARRMFRIKHLSWRCLSEIDVYTYHFSLEYNLSRNSRASR
jgi:hypothetical protein